ncbi:AraC family transcriptional regulator [Pelagibius sp. CAU 1746]|uniref:AraC family transcriptional regulator n=1 Tax=Pelagibius sp. CAU 1746 TaxID=3140370 RepID=UPI00325B6AF8
MSKRESTYQAWLGRFTRVADHVADNLDAPLDLIRLAEIACLSPYHFQRCWLAFTGETLAQMVTRLRLHRAAGELLRDDTAVETIGRRAGYGSAAAFTRAFARAYGRPPAAYRAAGRISPPLSINQKPEGDLRMFEVRIEDTEPLTLAAAHHLGDYMEIEKTFNRVMAHFAAKGALGKGPLQGPPRMIGVYYDDPDQVPRAELRADAGLVVPPDTEVEDPITLVELPGGPHAVLRFKGPYAELDGAYRWLYGTWLPQSGREPADAACFEDYLTNPREVPAAENVTEIHLPLKA